MTDIENLVGALEAIAEGRHNDKEDIMATCGLAAHTIRGLEKHRAAIRAIMAAIDTAMMEVSPYGKSALSIPGRTNLSATQGFDE